MQSTFVKLKKEAQYLRIRQIKTFQIVIDDFD